MATVKFGLEIECVHANDDLEVGSYHDGVRCGTYWNAQGDSSIHPLPRHKCQNPTEFVLNSPIEASQIPDALEELREIIGDTTDKMQRIEINESCGAHIHFSVFRRKLHRQLPFSVYGQIRKRTYREVQEHLPSVFGPFRKQYFRSYAKKLTVVRALNDRGVEFNSTEDTGIEWRSFNLMGVKKWSDMKKLYLIAADSIIGVLESHLSGGSPAYKGSFSVNNDDDLLGMKKMKIKNQPTHEFLPLLLPPKSGGLGGVHEIVQEDFGELFPSLCEVDLSAPDPPQYYDDDEEIYVTVKIGGRDVKIKPRSFQSD